ncbi:MAG: hypothetical protein RIC55_17705 [Pirellulaceae bacterium]
MRRFMQWGLLLMTLAVGLMSFSGCKVEVDEGPVEDAVEDLTDEG